MKKLSKILTAVLRHQSGAIAAEYAILLAVVVLIVGAVLFLGGSLSDTLATAAGCVETGCV